MRHSSTHQQREGEAKALRRIFTAVAAQQLADEVCACSDVAPLVAATNLQAQDSGQALNTVTQTCTRNHASILLPTSAQLLLTILTAIMCCTQFNKCSDFMARTNGQHGFSVLHPDTPAS